MHGGAVARRAASDEATEGRGATGACRAGLEQGTRQSSERKEHTGSSELGERRAQGADGCCKRSAQRVASPIEPLHMDMTPGVLTQLPTVRTCCVLNVTELGTGARAQRARLRVDALDLVEA